MGFVVWVAKWFKRYVRQIKGKDFHDLSSLISTVEMSHKNKSENHVIVTKYQLGATAVLSELTRVNLLLWPSSGWTQCMVLQESQTSCWAAARVHRAGALNEWTVENMH